jgi:hypothetical protein
MGNQLGKSGRFSASPKEAVDEQTQCAFHKLGAATRTHAIAVGERLINI